MGMDTASVKLACAARSLGVDFRSTLMVGRQALFPRPKALARVFAIHGIERDAERFLAENPYAEELFTALGARSVASIDASPYEDATILHDLNTPTPPSLHRKYSVVWDGGTIEHVFDIARAFKSCMEMVEVGGHFVQVNEANNYMGHGFWQISPEAVFRVLSPENGFEIVTVLLHEVVPGGAWYAVTDPGVAGSRVELCNSVPTYILTIAQRVRAVEILARAPQQSDYVDRWERDPVSGGESRPRGMADRLRRLLPRPVKRALKGVSRHSRAAPFLRPYFRRVREEDLLRGRLP